MGETKFKGTSKAKSVDFVFNANADRFDNKIKAKAALIGSEFGEYSMEVDGGVDGNVLKPEKEIKINVQVKTPISGFEKVGLHFEVEFEAPNFEIEVKVEKGVTIFEFKAELAAKKDKKVLKFNLICPELGLQDKNALRLELVHKFIDYDHSDQEKLNFEFGAAVAFFGFRNEGKIKMQRRLSRTTENDFPIPSKEDSFAGELVFYSDYIKKLSPILQDWVKDLADASLDFGCGEKWTNTKDGADHFDRVETYRCYFNKNEMKFEVKEKGKVETDALGGKYFYVQDTKSEAK